MKNNLEIKILLLISAFALLINVGSYGVAESSDARYAEISREMAVSGDYLHPNLLDIHHYHKPPLTYQITALGYKIFGINDFGARFFLQIALLFQLLLVYKLTLLLFNNKKTALWASMIYFSFPLVLASTRQLTTDAFLTTFAILSMYAWVKYRKSGVVGYLYLFTLSLGLGMLTKGPVIFIVPLIFILFYNRIEKPKNKFGGHHLLAWILFIAIGFSWYIYLVIHNPDFLEYFVGKQTVDRFSTNVFRRHKPFWYFIAYAPLVGLPWLLILPYLIKQNIKKITIKTIYFVLLAGIVIPLFFFSISSSKLILYILPFYSLIAILCAKLFENLNQDKIKIINRIIFYYTIILFVAFASTLFINIEFSFSKMLGIVSILLIPTTIIIYNSKKYNLKYKTVLISFIASVFLLIASSAVMSLNQLQINSPKPVTDFILLNHLNNRDILVYNKIRPSIAFELNKLIISLKDGDRKLERETIFEEDLNWKKYLIDMKKEDEIEYLKQILKKPTVLIVYKHPLPKNLEWMLKNYKENKVMGKYSIFY